jgi:hypothetical protein
MPDLIYQLNKHPSGKYVVQPYPPSYGPDFSNTTDELDAEDCTEQAALVEYHGKQFKARIVIEQIPNGPKLCWIRDKDLSHAILAQSQKGAANGK